MSETRINEIIVAAIDFGTTFSGYAYSYREEYLRDPLQIYSNRWDGQILPQAPTVLLFNSEKTESYFGFEAEEKYDGLIKRKEHKDWRYFRRFKMDLHREKKLTRKMTIKDAQGRNMPAVEVFAAAIRHLKNHFMEQAKLRVNIQENEVRWVITVPAIWSDDAKEFMVVAAEMAGIKEDKLSLAYEPEAAAIYCKHMRLAKLREPGKDATIQPFPTGLKFLVLDLGGAVLYGFNPSVISTRKSKYSYGISTSAPFVEELHPLSHRVQRDGSNQCEDIFKVFVKKGEEVIPGQTTATHEFNPSPLTRENQTIEVYKSEEDEPPKFVTECQKVGLVCFTVPDSDFDVTTVRVDMKFGGTQMTVSAVVNGPNGSKSVEAFFDWL
ncbi:heat shock 70 kDa protein 12B-like isoform X4 [Mya arenaria]|uniref:heat shock 70 kDa protein 12B-like isoform X4 n=1 Tax=Mya arenaria TaxID=6604 RepID=UPI0022E76CC1|nr:heat shock 70 kDa protein 12B-like isoform X4 [Mya arenaria]